MAEPDFAAIAARLLAEKQAAPGPATQGAPPTDAALPAPASQAPVLGSAPGAVNPQAATAPAGGAAPPAFNPNALVQGLPNPNPDMSTGNPVADTAYSAGIGVMESIYNTKDFLFGYTPPGQRSEARRNMEASSEAMARRSPVYGLTQGVAEFSTGMLGAGKLVGALKGAKFLAGASALIEGSKAVHTVAEVAKAAAVGAVAFDPMQQRLSNLVEAHPALHNPVTNYLASHDDDAPAEGRFKNALESIGMDAVAIPVFAAAVKLFKFAKGGAPKATVEAAGEALQQETEKAAAATEAQKTAVDPATGLPLKEGESGQHVVDANAPPAEATPPVAAPEAANGIPVETAPTAVKPGETINATDPTAPPEPAPLAANTSAPPVIPPDPALEVAAKGVAANTSIGDIVTAAEAASPPPEIHGLSSSEAQAAETSGPRAVPSGERVPTPGAKLLSEQQLAVNIPLSDLNRIIKNTAIDVAQIMAHGSRQGAIEAGHVFGGGELPWQKLRTSQDLQAFIGQVADAVQGQMDKAKGGEVLTDKRRARLTAARVALYEEDPDAVLGFLQAQGKNAKTMAANMEAADTIAVKLADEAYQVFQRINSGNLADFGGDIAKAKAELVLRSNLAMTALAAGRSMLSNSGRTLRTARGDVPRLSFDQIKKIKNLNADDLVKLFEGTGGDIKAIQRVLEAPTLMSRINDGLSFLLVNNLLWGWKTQVVNMATNFWMLMARPAEKLIGSAVGQLGNMVSFGHFAGQINGASASAIRTQAVREYRFMSGQAIDSFMLASKTFLRGDSVLAPHRLEALQVGVTGGRLDWRPVNNTGDALHNVMQVVKAGIGIPTRLLGAEDEFVKQVRYRSAVMAEASIEADRQGLKGPAWKTFINQRLSDSLDETGAATDARALAEAKITTFSQELTPGGPSAWIQNGVAQFPPLRFVLPFVRTPVNVLKYGLNYTPGLNLLQKQYQRAISGAMGAEQQAQAIGQLSLGALFMGVAAHMVFSGAYTGTGPTDPATRKGLMAAGWQPNSIVWHNDDGSTTYMPLSRFDPIGLPFGMIADLMDAMQHPDLYPSAEEKAGAVLLAMANQLRDRSYLTGITTFVDAMADPANKLSSYVGKTASNLIPAASLLRTLNPDPYQRDARGLVDNFMATVPGLSQNVRPRYDAYGDPITVRRGFNSDVHKGIVDEENVRMGLDHGFTIAPPPNNLNGVDLRGVTLETGQDAYDRYQQLSGHPPGVPPLKEALARAIANPGYQRLPDGPSSVQGTRQYVLSGITSQYHTMAKALLQRESAIFRSKLQEQVIKAQGAIHAAGPAEAAGGAAALSTLGKTYGLDLGNLLAPTTKAAGQ